MPSDIFGVVKIELTSEDFSSTIDFSPTMSSVSSSMSSEVSSSETSDGDLRTHSSNRQTRIETVVIPPLVAGGVLVVNVPMSYTPGQFDVIRESVLAAVEDKGVNVMFLPEGVTLAALSGDELWKMGLGVINRVSDEEAESVELPEEDELQA